MPRRHTEGEGDGIGRNGVEKGTRCGDRIDKGMIHMGHIHSLPKVNVIKDNCTLLGIGDNPTKVLHGIKILYNMRHRSI